MIPANKATSASFVNPLALRKSGEFERRSACQSVGQNGVHVWRLVYPVVDDEVRLQGASYGEKKDVKTLRTRKP